MDELRIIAPAAPGGGWDQTARAMQQALQRAGLVRLAPVENVPGAAGTIGLARFIGTEAGRRDVVMVSGLIMLGGIVTHRSPVTLARRHAAGAPHRRIRGHRRAGGVALPHAARSARRLYRAARVDLVGRRIGGRQRSDAGRAGGRRRRRGAARASTTSRSRAAASRCRRFSAGRSRSASTASPSSRRRSRRARCGRWRSRAPNGCRAWTCRRCASRASTIEFENWRSLVAPPGLTAADRARLEALGRGDGRARRRGARRWRATAGSIAIWRASLRPVRRRRGSARA